MDAVIFPDIVAETVTYLQAALDARPEAYADSVTVTNRYQGETPARQVVVSRDGGARNWLLEQPRIRLNVWAADDADATDLASMCLALLMAWPDGQPVVAARQLSGPSEVEEANGRSRRLVLAELTVRGTQLVPA